MAQNYREDHAAQLGSHAIGMRHAVANHTITEPSVISPTQESPESHERYVPPSSAVYPWIDSPPVNPSNPALPTTHFNLMEWQQAAIDRVEPPIEGNLPRSRKHWGGGRRRTNSTSGQRLQYRRLIIIPLVFILMSTSMIGVMLTHALLSNDKQRATKPVTTPTIVAQEDKIPPVVPLPVPVVPVIVTPPIQPQVVVPKIIPKPAPAPPPPPIISPPPSLPPVAGKDTGYNLGVLVIKYFPLTSNGQNINIGVTGDVGDPYMLIRQRTIDITNNLLTFIPKATTYLGYTYGGNAPSIALHVVATFEHLAAVPINATIHTGYPTYPDYYGIMNSHNICSYVDGQGVHEVFLYAYQGPNKPGTTQPYLGIAESKMSGPFGDISNSYRWDDMPHCQHTYVVYTFNYGRGTGEAIHSWSHQIEAELSAVDKNLFGLFQGPNYPQALGVTGRCGSVHNPPNARQEYDWSNTTSQLSDCRDWQPNGIGTLTNISCVVWGCTYVSDSNNSQLNWIVWMWQNLPGRNNVKIYQNAQLRNWWDVHGAFDTVMSSSKRLTL